MSEQEQDIVERLRLSASKVDPLSCEVMESAADEIERLRAGLHEALLTIKVRAEEVARLRASSPGGEVEEALGRFAGYLSTQPDIWPGDREVYPLIEALARFVELDRAAWHGRKR